MNRGFADLRLRPLGYVATLGCLRACSRSGRPLSDVSAGVR